MVRIAVIEDTLDHLEVISMILADGYSVEPFPTGSAFIDEFEPSRIGLIIVDLVMRNDGYDIIKRIR